MNSQILKIDEEFKQLIHPLKRQEYLQLESNIIADGCRDPIIVWKGYIIDGHNRYEICTRHGIPFETQEKTFVCREEAIAWICANQLGRRNISEETRKFLIGMQYESEKLVTRFKNARGHNQYKGDRYPNSADEPETPSRHTTAKRIADENHVSIGTVQKYAIYTRALEEIGKKEPKLVPKILSGNYKISHENVVELSKLSQEDIQRVNRKIDRNPTPFIQYKKTRNAIQTGKYEAIPEETLPPVPSVKDMPEYDPDAEVTGLTLTIPSWCSSIERTKKNTNFDLLSASAKEKLLLALFELDEKMEEMLLEIKEDK